MKRYRVQALCLLLAAALALTGCAARRGGEDTGKLQVVCTLFPYYDFVRAIGGDRVEPYLLVTAGREAHSFEPTPLDVIRISQADVFICNGGESETWVDDILDAAGVTELPETWEEFTQALEKIKAAGYDVVTPVIVCNTPNFPDMTVKSGMEVREGDTVIELN